MTAEPNWLDAALAAIEPAAVNGDGGAAKALGFLRSLANAQDDAIDDTDHLAR